MHKQRHRGIHPKDVHLFGPNTWKKLGDAVLDLHHLLNRGYREESASRIVGDHYLLQKRQRFALQKIVSSQPEIRITRNRELPVLQIKGQHLAIDGFNLLIFAEVLFSGGFIFECLDGIYRDIASIHGSYHQIVETKCALEALDQLFEEMQADSVTWYLDRPVSNSGKLGTFIRQYGETNHRNWQVQIVANPDHALIENVEGIIITNDRQVLLKGRSWFNLSRLLIEKFGTDSSHLISLQKLGLQAGDIYQPALIISDQ